MDIILSSAIFAIIFGMAFLVIEYIDRKYLKLHTSIVAGISVAYFFLLVLPEISLHLPEPPFNLVIFEFLFVLIGFVFIHVTEKLILQRVDRKSRMEAQLLTQKEKILETVELNLENIMTTQLLNEDFDEVALKDMARVFNDLNTQSGLYKRNIKELKAKIQKDINRDLSELRLFTDVFYHFIIGMVLVGLLMVDLLTGLLFFLFAWLRTLIGESEESHIIYSELEIYDRYEESKVQKLLKGIATISGVVLNLIFEIFLPVKIELELIYILFSFISGVILYTIVREVIPEKEKGNVSYFLISLVGFSLFVFVLKVIESVL